MKYITDPDDSISLEAMKGLAKLFTKAEEERIAPFLLNLCNQIKPSFEKVQPQIRSSSANLFEILSKFGNAPSVKEGFLEQIHSVLPAIVLHINDEDSEVRKSFRKLLFSISSFLNSELVTLLSTSYIFNVESDNDYNEFLRLHLSKILVALFPDRMTVYIDTCMDKYFSSSWDTIKGNACFFVATLMFNIPEENRENLNIVRVSKEIVQLLQEKSSYVRMQASVAISLLHSY